MRKQKNGRERGNPGNGNGHWADWNGGRATRTANKRDREDQRARRDKSRGYRDD
jgi:hypothetical protein